MNEFLKRVANIFSCDEANKYHNDMEKFIIDHHPETTHDLDCLEREYNRVRFTGMGRHEYFPVTR